MRWIILIIILLVIVCEIKRHNRVMEESIQPKSEYVNPYGKDTTIISIVKE